jgi:WhiB family redox-sensing transcriptional regulator
MSTAMVCATADVEEAGLVSGAHERRQRADEPVTARLITRGQWRQAAACRSADPDQFFPISDSGPAREQLAKAKAICATCRVRRECLVFALGTGQVYGIWGGQSEHERAAVQRRTAIEQPTTNEWHPA